MSTMPDLRAAALALAEAGFAVVPVYEARGPGCSCGRAACAHPGKHPRTPHGLLDATADLATIRRWWRAWPHANVAIRTGAVSGVFVVDVDPRHHGDAALAALVAEHGPLPDTLRVLSGGRGTHKYFEHPGCPVPSRNGALGPGLDVKGDGGYVLAPPSNHVSGGEYVVDSGELDDESLVGIPRGRILSAPDWLLDLVCAPSSPPAAKRRRVVGRPARPASGTGRVAAESALARALCRSRLGSRNDVGFRLACALRDAGLTFETATGYMVRYASLVPPSPPGEPAYTDGEAIASLRSAFRQAPAGGGASR